MDEQWVVNQLEKIACFNRGERGITRLAFSEEDLKARDYIIILMKELGLSVRVDEIGNIIGRLVGKSEDAPAVLTGSHLDTVPEGGKYDGVVGIVGALAAIQQLKLRGLLTCPVEVIVFVAEESSRFGIATMGSKAMAGLVSSHMWVRAKDQEGVAFSQIMSTQGYDIKKIIHAARSKKDIKAFVELHIEQGTILETEGDAIGIVETIAAPTRCKIIVEGVAAHSGTTSMDERQDALVSAAMIILAVQEIALGQAHRGVVATVGALKVYPGVINVVPGLVEMWVDLRGIEHESIIESLQEIKDAVSTIADAQEIAVSIEMISSEKPARMDQKMNGMIEEICKTKGITYQYMNSRAGHDAMNMTQVAPTSMIFIPCQKGISHNPAEYVAPKDIMAGIEVLTETIYQLAK